MKKAFMLLLASILCLVAFAACVTDPVVPTDPNAWPADEGLKDSDYTHEDLVWQDEFNGTELDMTKWSYEIGNGESGWGNQELQYYTDENARVNGGKLQIMAKNIPHEGYSYTSSRIKTAGKFSKTYGKFEARMKLPTGSGLWPAFWMMPQNDTYGKGWPMNGEIDIMEAKGRFPRQSSCAIHWGSDRNDHNYKGGTKFHSLNGDVTINDFHTYTLIWREKSIEIFVDGTELENRIYKNEGKWYTTDGNGGKDTESGAPFDQPFYIIFNLAVGGTFDPGAFPEAKDFGALMEVDYVRVYK